jgi:hypothetical protein
MENKYLDCFGYQLKDGDDVLVSIYDIIYCGIISEMTDEYFVIDYQTWKGEEEIIKRIKYYNYDTIKGKFLNIYKIR